MKTRKAFTLTETLVAVAIFALLMVILMQISGMISGAWRKSQAMADNYDQARLTLWLIEQDIQSMIVRADVASFVDADGVPGCAFYTEVAGEGTTRPVSLVSYTINPSTNRLQRGNYSLDYAALSATLGTTDRLPDLAKAIQEDLVDGMVLFKIQFLNSDGTLGTTFNSSTAKSIVVSLAVLDGTAFQLVRQNNWLPSIRNVLGETAPTGISYADLWNGIIDSGGMQRARLAAPILSGLRVYSKIIPLPST